MPRNTAIFEPTFRGRGTVRSDDILADPRYGKSAPYHGMPKGHLPVRSYLAVPVVSRSNEVLGGLFFGHEQPRVFSERAERLVSGLAAQAAVAIDNARLHQSNQTEIAARRSAEEALHEANQDVGTTRGRACQAACGQYGALGRYRASLPAARQQRHRLCNLHARCPRARSELERGSRTHQGLRT